MIWSPRYLIEPVVMLFMFTYITSVIYSYGLYQSDMWYDLTKNKTLVSFCLYHKQAEVCRNLSERSTKPLSMFNTYLSIEMGVVGIFVNFGLGYISDRVSRTLLLKVAVISVTVSCAVQLLNSLVMSTPVWVFYISSFVTYIMGGFGAFMGTSMAFISDISDRDSRTARIAIADGMLQLGALFGALIGGELMAYSTWYATPLLCNCVNVCLLLYIVVVIRNPARVKKPKCNSFKEMLSSMADVYTAPSRHRTRIYILSAAYLLHFTAFLAYAGFFINYLLNPPFNWQTDKIGLVSTISSVANFVMVMTVPLMKKARLPEPLIAALSCTFCCAGFAVATIARSFGVMVVANILKAGSGVALAIYRARLSKLVQPSQFGQLFSLLNSCECIAGLVASVGLYQVYIYTRKWFNGFTFIILLVLEVVALLLTLLDGWYAKQQGSIDDEDDDEDLLVVPDGRGLINSELEVSS